MAMMGSAAGPAMGAAGLGPVGMLSAGRKAAAARRPSSVQTKKQQQVQQQQQQQQQQQDAHDEERPAMLYGRTPLRPTGAALSSGVSAAAAGTTAAAAVDVTPSVVAGTPRRPRAYAGRSGRSGGGGLQFSSGDDEGDADVHDDSFDDALLDVDTTFSPSESDEEEEEKEEKDLDGGAVAGLEDDLDGTVNLDDTGSSLDGSLSEVVGLATGRGKKVAEAPASSVDVSLDGLTDGSTLLDDDDDDDDLDDSVDLENSAPVSPVKKATAGQHLQPPQRSPRKGGKSPAQSPRRRSSPRASPRRMAAAAALTSENARLKAEVEKLQGELEAAERDAIANAGEMKEMTDAADLAARERDVAQSTAAERGRELESAQLTLKLAKDHALRVEAEKADLAAKLAQAEEVQASRTEANLALERELGDVRAALARAEAKIVASDAAHAKAAQELNATVDGLQERHFAATCLSIKLTLASAGIPYDNTTCTNSLWEDAQAQGLQPSGYNAWVAKRLQEGDKASDASAAAAAATAGAGRQ